MRDGIEPLPSLWHNGALDPDLWEPCSDNRRSPGPTRPGVGDLVAWRYAGWRVTAADPVDVRPEGAADRVGGLVGLEAGRGATRAL